MSYRVANMRLKNKKKARQKWQYKDVTQLILANQLSGNDIHRALELKIRIIFCLPQTRVPQRSVHDPVQVSRQFFDEKRSHPFSNGEAGFGIADDVAGFGIADDVAGFGIADDVAGFGIAEDLDQPFSTRQKRKKRMMLILKISDKQNWRLA